MPGHNLRLLADASRLLQPLLEKIVFLGGCTTALFITDSGAAEVRTSYDVDAIAAITSYAGYLEFSAQLRRLGFAEDRSEGAPVCRWKCGEIVFDLMPLDRKILGFSNRWYGPAMDAARDYALEPGLSIRAVTAVYFCATKLEAFAGRGGHDYLSSRDLEDLVAVIDGRSGIVAEVEQAPADVRSYIGGAVGKLLRSPAFLDALPGYLLPDAASQQRLPALLARLRAIATLA